MKLKRSHLIQPKVPERIQLLLHAARAMLTKQALRGAGIAAGEVSTISRCSRADATGFGPSFSVI